MFLVSPSFQRLQHGSRSVSHEAEAWLKLGSVHLVLADQHKAPSAPTNGWPELFTLQLSLRCRRSCACRAWFLELLDLQTPTVCRLWDVFPGPNDAHVPLLPTWKCAHSVGIPILGRGCIGAHLINPHQIYIMQRCVSGKTAMGVASLGSELYRAGLWRLQGAYEDATSSPGLHKESQTRPLSAVLDWTPPEHRR